MKESATNIRCRLLRHATLFIEINGIGVLIDPMLSAREEMNPVTNATNNIRIPMVDLPFGYEKLISIIQQTDLVLLTHLHRDHWDDKAKVMLNKKLPVLCQPEDAKILRMQGFEAVIGVGDHVFYKGIEICRTGGLHGTGEVGERMGNVSGFVLKYGAEALYIAGDTIWCSQVEEALNRHQPQKVVVNAGGAQFLTGAPITMTAADVTTVARKAPFAKVVAVHMDTVNHCMVGRRVLRAVVEQEKLTTQISIPEDGEWF